MKTRTLRSWAVLSVASALLAGGCGGGSSSGPGSEEEGEVVRTAGGEVIRTSDGRAVTIEAHNNWTEGLRLFAQYEQEGWNAERCEQVDGKFEEAVDAQHGAFAEAEYMRGLSLSRCGDTSGARDHYETALEASPNLCTAKVAIAVMEQEAGRVREAKAMYEQAIEADGQCTEAYVNLARIQARGDAAQVDEAIQNVRRALAVESQYLPAFNELALIYYRRGESAQNRSWLDLAEIVCRQAELIDNHYAPIYNTWGLVKMRRGDLIEALRFFERAIQLDSSLYEAQMNFAQITNSFRGYEDARTAFGRAVELQPRSYDAIVGLGAALRGLGQIDEAEAQYNRARELDDQRPEAYYNLALIYHDYKSGTEADLNRAKEYYQQFLQRAGDNPRYSEAKELVTRRCRDAQTARRGRRRIVRSSSCRPGRIQLIEQTVAAIHEGEAMQREMEEMQRQQEEMERQQSQEGAAPESKP